MAGLERKMRQTTVRFGADLWADLEREAERGGVSAAQYIRDATLARIAYSAGARSEPGPGSAAQTADSSAITAVSKAHEHVSDSEAVWAQARLARERARLVRDAARGVQREGPRKQLRST